MGDNPGVVAVEYTTMSAMGEKAIEIVRILRGAGFRAYWAGGSVRDLVMGHDPQDYDVATDAHPEQVMRLFSKTVPVGVSFGVVKVIENEFEFEVTTFRSDGRYIDGRHPTEVHYSDDREDAARRDFTINGMFYDPLKKEIIDYVEGRRDIAAGVIRAIGDPRERFEEDKLRLMRAVRFAARFGYVIEPKTEAALRDLAGQIQQISAERIRDEFKKMLTGPNPSEGISLLIKTGLMKTIMPEVMAMDGVEQPEEFHPEGDVLTHTMLLLKNLDHPSFELALAALLHDVGKPPTFSIRDRIRFDNHCEVGARMTEAICGRLRLSNEQTERVADLVRDHLRFKDVQQMRESTLKRFLRQPYFSDHLELHRLDCLASHGDLTNWEFCKRKLAELGPEEIRPKRLLTGDDLIAMGYRPGPLFTKILTQVEDAQLEGSIKSRDEAVEWLRREFGSDDV